MAKYTPNRKEFTEMMVKELAEMSPKTIEAIERAAKEDAVLLVTWGAFSDSARLLDIALFVASRKGVTVTFVPNKL